MKLFSEIVKALSAEVGTGGQYTVVDGQGGYFQNVKRILEFSAERIVLCGKKGCVRVEGKNLRIGKYYAGDVAVVGEIERVERESC